MKKTFLYWIFQIFFGCIRFLWHCILSLKYGGKGKVVSPVTKPLLLKSATQLAREIRNGKIKSEEVVQAYIERILEVEPYINATGERCFEDALTKAREVDSLVVSGNHSKEFLLKEKPLLGVPFSVKLQFMVKDLPCTSGCKLFENLIAVRDAPAVAMMKKAGAILITTTNIPELTTDLETTNELYGRTRNPYDANRTSGGTSGGEAALIAAGGSVLGLGTDSLGSVRIPAHFTGIFSHKPTRDLVPNEGCFPPESPDKPPKLPKPDIYKIVSTGPMCRYAEDLVISMRILSFNNGIKTNFDKQVDFRKIKVRYLKEIRSPGVPPVHKDIANALKKAVYYLENHYNITAEEVKMPLLYDAMRCIMGTLHRYVKNPKETLLGSKDSDFNEKKDFLKSFIGKSVLNFTNLAILNFSFISEWYMHDKVSYYEKMSEDWSTEFNKLLDENTVLLMPTSPVIAPYHSESTLLIPIVCYSGIFNITGLPVTHCPMGLTKKGLPYGIQIVGRANNDALTIACAIELEKAFGGWKSPGEL
ncbi:fatty-acid amide hydrolase 2-B-like isoform X1 [Argiope bruennichi]|uniref:fatty-acid amide hydrolase 2-B-like isoform X1 n=1 Tax=Argiope bruennichi TaxID=94029 RepID=UPI002494A2BB|nr:fatty-acid amide hydrolase 2-B-like isoform X1 [Argiope bruennichi]XP_055940188.1 fatty-acid amide hydrolase 2-B-like isoform X1 [Argiope bruennichi]